MAPADEPGGRGTIAPGASVSVIEAFLADRDQACPGCGYNLRGLQGDHCPECGRAVVLEIRDENRIGRWAIRVARTAAGCFAGIHLASLVAWGWLILTQGWAMVWRGGSFFLSVYSAVNIAAPVLLFIFWTLTFIALVRRPGPKRIRVVGWLLMSEVTLAVLGMVAWFCLL